MTVDNPTPTQRYINDLIESQPEMSNADIAEETGTHTALVRDIRAQQEEDTDDDTSSTGPLSSQTGVLDDLAETQAAVLQRAASDPGLSNAELAEAVGTHTALVRDLGSDVQAQVLAHTIRNPDATNAEIAAELDTHTAVVRDARGGVRAAILERSVRDPTLSNAELAEELGTNIATVRDERMAYEDSLDENGYTPGDDETGGAAATDTGTGMSRGTLVAVLVGVLLLVAVLLVVV